MNQVWSEKTFLSYFFSLSKIEEGVGRRKEREVPKVQYFRYQCLEKAKVVAKVVKITHKCQLLRSPCEKRGRTLQPDLKVFGQDPASAQVLF